MMDALDKKKAFLLRGDDLARMQRLLAEWETLTVHQTDAKTPSLTRGTLATRLEIPKATPSDADHPFKVIDASDATGPKVRVLPGLLNAGFPTVGGQNNVFVKSDTHSANAPRLSLSGQRYWYVWLEASGIAEHEGVRLPSPEAADIFAQYDDGTFEGSSSLGPLFTSRVPLAFIELTEDLSGVSRIVQFVNGHMRCTALSMYPLQPQTVYHFFG